MIKREEMEEIIKESPFTKLYDLKDREIEEIIEEVYERVGEVYMAA